MYTARQISGGWHDEDINLTTRETVNKRDGHIPIEQQALARIGVGDVGKLVL